MSSPTPAPLPANFLRTVIEQDLATGAFDGRRYGGRRRQATVENKSTSNYLDWLCVRH